MSSLRFAALPLLALSIASGCADDPQSGNLSVNYQLGAANNCMVFDVPIEEIRVSIGNGEATETAPCNPDEPVVLNGVKAGTKDILVEAIDAENFVVMDNQAPPESDDRVEVHGGSSTEIDVNLSATPAVLQFRWVISVDMFPSMCNQVPTKTFEISAFENGGSGLLFGPFDFDCELPEPSYNAVPDPDRDINGSDLDYVTVEIQDAGGAEIDTVSFTFDPPGPGRVLSFDITCDASSDPASCMGSVMLPPGTGTSATDGGTGDVDSSSGGADSTGSSSG